MGCPGDGQSRLESPLDVGGVLPEWNGIHVEWNRRRQQASIPSRTTWFGFTWSSYNARPPELESGLGREHVILIDIYDSIMIKSTKWPEWCRSQLSLSLFSSDLEQSLKKNETCSYVSPLSTSRIVNILNRHVASVASNRLKPLIIHHDHDHNPSMSVQKYALKSLVSRTGNDI